MTKLKSRANAISRRAFVAAGIASTALLPKVVFAQSDGVPTLRVAYAQGIQANFYYALQNDLFAKHGVNVVGTKFDSGPALITALVSGSADVGYFGAPALIAANSRGANLQIFSVANLAGSMAALYVRPESGIKSAQDLVGKSVATTRNTVTHIFMDIAFNQAGIDPASVELQFLDPQALVAGYVRGDLDAVWMFASVGAKLISNGASIVPSTSATAIGLEDAGSFIADASFIESNREALVRFQRAVDEATPITNESREKSLIALDKGIGLVGGQAEIILDYMPVAGVTAKDLADPNSPVSLTSTDGYQRIVDEMYQAMVRLEILDTEVDSAALINPSIVTAA